MEQSNNSLGMLDLMDRPAFCVQNNRIVKANTAAEACLIVEGAQISEYLHTGKTEYSEFQEGCLFLNLNLTGISVAASVTRVGEYDVFTLEQEDDQTELRTMALAARELRKPLSNIMAIAERLFPVSALQEDDRTKEAVARMNRGLFQMQRILCNMADAERYSASRFSSKTTVDICAFLQAIFDRSQELVSHANIRLRFQNLPKSVFCLVDEEKLERAVLNILSNALKFTPREGQIEARLTRRGETLRLSVQDSGSGIPDAIRSDLHHRYLRQLQNEDGRYGIGLGMVLIRSAAAEHGGTVLIDHPDGVGTRITMTLEIRQNTDTTLRTPILRPDYAGGWAHEMVELAEHLPPHLYDAEALFEPDLR